MPKARIGDRLIAKSMDYDCFTLGKTYIVHDVDQGIYGYVIVKCDTGFDHRFSPYRLSLHFIFGMRCIFDHE